MEISNPGFEEKRPRGCDFIEHFGDFATQNLTDYCISTESRSQTKSNRAPSAFF